MFAAFNDSGIASLGCVFRDSKGSFLGGFYHHQLHVSSARHAELLALLLGVGVARSHSFVPLVVESDCLDLVRATNSSSLDDLEFDFLVDDLRHALHAFSTATLRHVRRTANMVVHLIAREAIKL